MLEWINEYIIIFIYFLMCHMIGDYVLQIDYIAKTKGKMWYHMFVHCVLYCVPFAVVFGMTWQLGFIFVAHLIVDPLKARWNKTNYFVDQCAHLACVIVYWI